MGLTRRKLFKSGFLFSLFAIAPPRWIKPTSDNIKLVRTFHYPISADNRLHEELTSYMNYEALYFLDSEFQIKGKLLSINYSKPFPNQVLVVRVFQNQASCDEWRQLYKDKCVLEHANLSLFQHRLEEKVLPA